MEEKTLELSFRGSRNQRIIHVPESLRQGKAVCITSGRWAGDY
jgi:anaerobic ribonucleoside-triphosphate reductase activating protein